VTATIVAEPWLDVSAVHSEGVTWDAAGDRLLFVDIPRGRVFVASLHSGSVDHFDVPGTVGAVHPTVDPQTLVIADRAGIALCSGGHVTKRLAVRMNEANVDPAGRYFAGSMAFDQQPGAACLYRLDVDLGLKTVLTNVTISNGLDWSPDNSRCYYIDSPLHRVDVFDYDIARGDLANRRPFVDTSGVPGLPDGLTVDADGSVWVAFFGGGRVCRYDPDGSLADTVELPVTQVTSCCFGGPDLDQLIISTSTEDLNADELREQPAAGQLFRAATDFRGRAQQAFRGVPAN
jgi:sugar lactone lactonase YvrE